jgi:hypothetical protein
VNASYVASAPHTLYQIPVHAITPNRQAPLQGTMMASPSVPVQMVLPGSATLKRDPALRPRSQANWNTWAREHNMYRDQLSLQSWLLVGATLQAILVLLPISKKYTVAPILILAVCKLLHAVVEVSSYRPGQDGHFIGKRGGTVEYDPKSDGGVCLFVLGTRCYQ